MLHESACVTVVKILSHGASQSHHSLIIRIFKVHKYACLTILSMYNTHTQQYMVVIRIYIYKHICYILICEIIFRTIFMEPDLHGK